MHLSLLFLFFESAQGRPVWVVKLGYFRVLQRCYCVLMVHWCSQHYLLNISCPTHASSAPTSQVALFVVLGEHGPVRDGRLYCDCNFQKHDAQWTATSLQLLLLAPVIPPYYSSDISKALNVLAPRKNQLLNKKEGGGGDICITVIREDALIGRKVEIILYTTNVLHCKKKKKVAGMGSQTT